MTLRRLLTIRLSSDASDARFAARAFFAAALAVVPLGLLAVARMTTTSAEVLLGSLLTCCLALQLVVAGFLMERRGT